MDERPHHPDESRPAEYKVACDGQAGLVRVPFVGPPHEGRSLYIDEPDLPSAIWTSGRPDRFEWWHEHNHTKMIRTAVGSDSGYPPVRYVLRVPEDTREPLFESERRVSA